MSINGTEPVLQLPWFRCGSTTSSGSSPWASTS